ncbi:hypothetical protein [Streptomyces sp. Act143]|uniref:hypothetical protein n=1 Tax=Streptomyces sp. Act143 TaxID=2200760 RepID=UPI0026BE4461|nr:hypothetical protein [Streptomyces sp. Act143]
MTGASAAVVCLGVALTSCGSTGEGRVAVGAAGGPSASAAARPTGSVRVVPLDGEPTPRASTPGSGDSPAPGDTSAPAAPATPSGGPTGGGPMSGAPTSGVKSGRTGSGSPSPTASSSRTTAPAALTWDDPVRAAGERRWCEDVTLVFHNSGDAAVRSGTVGFGTHIIGALGVDWGTVESEVDLPAPIAGGTRKERTWTVCVEAWRVPLGMHVETRDVDVRWT